jgi:hypothetical protein
LQTLGIELQSGGKKKKRRKTGSVQMKVLGVQVDVEFGIRYYIPKKNMAGIPIKL